MKKWQQRWMAVVTALGFVDKAKAGKLTKDEQKQIFAKYEEEYTVTFEADKKANEDADPTPPPAGDDTNILSEEEQASIAAALNGGAPEGSQGASAAPAPTTAQAAITPLVGKIKEQQAQINQLGNQQDPPTPAGTVKMTNQQTMAIVMGHTSHTADGLFGIKHSVYARGSWWNEMTVSRKAPESDHTVNELTSFKASFNEFGSLIAARYNELSDNHQLSMLNWDKMIAGEVPIDYSGLSNNPLTSEFAVRRMDMIITYIRTLPSVANIFPVHSGVQNKEIVTNAFFGEFSQARQSGRVFKGSAKFTPEIIHVDAVMFKHAFENLDELEKQYIGYLNHEGSNPMKWTFIEWMMVNIYKVLFNEQQRRRVIGVRVPIQKDVDNPALFGADGVYRAVERLEEQFKVLPFKDLKLYDETTMLSYYETMYKYVNLILPNMVGYRMYGNLKHRPWFVELYRAKYGKDMDFTGVKDQIIDLSPENIIWVPNMDANDYKVLITLEGNLENYELVPGEMFAVYFQQDLDILMAMSNWKGGAGALQAGLQCATEAELAATKRKYQYIFTNYPVSTLAVDATVIDGSVNYTFETAANTKATAITDIQNGSSERVYKVICGSATNATTITKAGKFAKIANDWVPKAAGDYIKLYAELELANATINGETVQITQPTGNWLELERKVTA
jgi:hypothetical protein